MLEEIENAQEAPEKEAHLQPEGSQEVVTESSPAPEESAPSEAEAKAPAEEEKIVLTKTEFDNQSAKIKAIAERKAKREAEARYQAEYEKLQSQSATQQQQGYQQNTQPSPDHVWDDLLGWMHKDIRNNPDSYAQVVSQAVQSVMQPQNSQPQQPYQQQQQSQQPTHPTQPSQQFGGLSKNALDQIDELVVEHDDFVATAAQLITPSMANAAAFAPNGMKMLYDMYKDNPSDLFHMAKLSPDEQKFKVWEMHKEKSAAKTAKVSTSATPQVAPLEANGIVNKDYADLSFAERKKRSLAASWED